VNDTAEVAAVLACCNRLNVPVVPFGAGTSLEGQVHAVHGGITVSLANMDKVLAISQDDLDCRVEAGVTREALNASLRHSGLMFPVDPGANATLGGMAATRASGTTSVRYGTMRDLVIGTTVVTPDGGIIKTGGRARKSAAGYDLTRLYLGSEGTLGIMTELQLRLFGVPDKVAAGVCQFPEVGSAVAAVTLILQSGIDVARIELLDRMQMEASIAYSKLHQFQPRPTLFFEFHGSEVSVAEQVERVRLLTLEFGGQEFVWASDQESRTQLWTARHHAYPAARALAPGKSAIATDACVPISKLAECILTAQEEARSSKLLCPVVGHVGDGNFHALIMFDADDAREREAAEKLAYGIARRAIAVGGTCTGEHGIGLSKLDLLREEHGEGVSVMLKIKRALDPNNIMNPGKTVQ
jgi:D-lactate dehydrogenase (cytochrome)